MTDNQPVIQPIIHTVSATQITNNIVISAPGPQGPVGQFQISTIPTTYPITNVSGSIGYNTSYVPASSTYSSSATYSINSSSATYSSSAVISSSTAQTNFSNLTISGSQVATQAYVLDNIPASATLAGSALYANQAGSSSITSQTNFITLTVSGSNVATQAYVNNHDEIYYASAQSYSNSGSLNSYNQASAFAVNTANSASINAYNNSVIYANSASLNAYNSASTFTTSQGYQTSTGSVAYATNSGNSNTTNQTNFNSLTLSGSNVATQSYVGVQISNLVDSAPATLDTLNELAAALGDDPNYAATTASLIGTKAPLTSSITIGSTSIILNTTTSSLGGVVINNSSSVLSPLLILNNTNTAPSTAQGTLYYEPNTFGPAVITDTPSPIHMLEQVMIRAVNDSSATILKGQAVYLSGAQGNRPAVKLGIASSASAHDIIGIVYDDIAAHQDGWIITQGLIEGIDTRPYIEGAYIYLSAASAGYLTASAPSYPNYAFVVAQALNSTVNGRLLVEPYNAYNQVNVNGAIQFSDGYRTIGSANAKLDLSGGASLTNILVSGSITGSATYSSSAGYASNSGNLGGITSGSYALQSYTDSASLNSYNQASAFSVTQSNSASLNAYNSASGYTKNSSWSNTSASVKYSSSTGFVSASNVSGTVASATNSSSAAFSSNSASLGGLQATDYVSDTDYYNSQLTPTTAIDLFARTSISGTRTLGAGTIYFTGFVPIKNFTLNSVTVVLTTIGTSSLQFGLFSTSGSIVTVIASTSIVLPSGAGAVTASFSTPQTLTSGQSYAIGFLAVGGTSPVMVGQTISTTNAAISYGLSPLMAANSSTTTYTSIPVSGSITLNTVTAPIAFGWARLT